MERDERIVEEREEKMIGIYKKLVHFVNIRKHSPLLSPLLSPSQTYPNSK